MKYNDNGLWKTLNVKVTDTLPVGTIISYAGTTIPSNYMKCEGQELSRIEYDILFSAIGTTYGEGNGSTTFNLPNLKGRVITGIDSNDTDFDALGETGGEKTHTLTVDEMPSHSHLQNNTPKFQSNQIMSSGSYTLADTEINNVYTEPTGGGEAHNNLQPYIVLNYIIKVLDAPAIQAQVVNGYSTSSRDSYSCNYVNKLNTYSTDEIRIGTWMGKPLYRKVFTGNISSSIEHGLTNVNFVNSYGYVISGTGNFMPLPSLRVAYPNYNIGYYVTNQNIVFEKGSEASGTATITLEYTKTTD